MSVLLQAEERRTAEKRRSDSDRGPESEHSRKVSRTLCPSGGTLVLEEETSASVLKEAAMCSDAVPTVHPLSSKTLLSS